MEVFELNFESTVPLLSCVQTIGCIESRQRLSARKIRRKSVYKQNVGIKTILFILCVKLKYKRSYDTKNFTRKK